MPNISVLPKEISELIAAGEVVERPASVIKELVENSIDAGATIVTVEIERGGITYMRVTDNGCGIAKDQIKTAFLRHATSKIKTANDLDEILTLGFRGEALASISAVSKVEIMSAVRGEIGVSYSLEGGEEISFEEIGCPTGTTIVVRDLFYNVPARMKFLKKDVSEGNTVAAIMDRIALSHPEVAIKLIRDGKTVLNTGGDGKLKSAIYSVLGRDFSSSMVSLEYDEGVLSANGFTCIPSRCRPNRNGQFFFLNGRYIKSGTMAAALDQAYKNSSMVGKFPACVINLTLPPETVDVNVHPTKTEVRFSDERRVFDIVYRAVKQAITLGDRRPELNIGAKNPLNPFANTEKFTQAKVDIISAVESDNNKVISEVKKEQITIQKPVIKPTKIKTEDIPTGFYSYGFDEKPKEELPFTKVTPETEQSYISKKIIDIEVEEQPTEEVIKSENKSVTEVKKAEPIDAVNPDIDPSLITYIGEAFATYIMVSHGETLYLIDKHAAHERINFEKLKKEIEIQSQVLLAPISLTMVREEYSAVISNIELLEQCGFMVEDFGGSTVLVRSVPSILSGEDISLLMSEIAENLISKGSAVSDKIDDILHSIACKSAIKAGNITSKEEQLSLAIKVLTSKSLMYCPHGRPIAFSLTKAQIEKQFGRLGS